MFSFSSWWYLLLIPACPALYVLARRSRPAYTLMWYVLSEFLVSFGFTVIAMSVLGLLLLSYQMASEYDFVTVTQALLLSPFILPKALVLALPPATMIATIMVFGRLSAENEIIAAQAGGAALRRIVWPLFFCSVVISASSLWLQDAGLKWSNDMLRTVVLKLNNLDAFIQTLDKPGATRTIPSDTGYTRINMLPVEKGPNGEELRPIQIVTFVNNMISGTIFAKDHTIKAGGAGSYSMTLNLKGVQSYGAQYTTAADFSTGMPLPDPATMITLGNTRGQKSWQENLAEGQKIAKDEHRRWEFLLRRASNYGALAAAGSPLDPAAPALIANEWMEVKLDIESIVGQGGALYLMREDKIEFHRKVALSTLPISMIFLGIGLGLLVKKSNRMIGFLLGLIMYFLLYYPSTILAKALSSSGNWEKFSKFCPPQYFPNIAFLLFGYMLWRSFERGAVFRLPEFVLVVLRGLLDVCKGVVWLFEKLVFLPIRIFRRTTDIYVGSSFLTPLLIVILCFAGFFTFLDVVDHWGEIVEGVRHSLEPQGALPPRESSQAVLDVFSFYGIQALEFTLMLLPAEVLIAGMLCAMVLVRNQEHLILKSSGVRLQRAMRPAIILAILACGCVSLVREMWMPELLLFRDALKPQVYHRNSQPTSLALFTLDENKQPILFEMGQYNTAEKRGKELCIYLLAEQKTAATPIPTLVADVAVWNAERNGWELFTDPAVQEMKLLEQTAIGGSKKPNKPEKDKDAKKPKPAPEAVRSLITGGMRFDTEFVQVASAQKEPAVSPVTVRKKTRVDFWQGPINPRFIDSDRMGAKVMRLDDLRKLSELKPEMMVEFYKRISEFAMGFLLLWCALPLMFNDTSHGAVSAMGISVLIGVVYWAMSLASVKFAIDARAFELFAQTIRVPVWAPIVPHGIFFVAGFIQFYWRMQT